VRFDIQPGKEGFVDFKSSSECMVYRAKNGHLMVVGPHNAMHTNIINTLETYKILKV